MNIAAGNSKSGWSVYWQRFKAYVLAFDEALDYDLAQHTARQLAQLRKELAELQTRISQIESNPGGSLSELEERAA